MPIDSTANHAENADSQDVSPRGAPGSLESLEAHLDLAAGRIVGGIHANTMEGHLAPQTLADVLPVGLQRIEDPPPPSQPSDSLASGFMASASGSQNRG